MAWGVTGHVGGTGPFRTVGDCDPQHQHADVWCTGSIDVVRTRVRCCAVLQQPHCNLSGVTGTPGLYRRTAEIVAVGHNCWVREVYFLGIYVQ